jgi:hypothetical protein
VKVTLVSSSRTSGRTKRIGVAGAGDVHATGRTSGDALLEVGDIGGGGVSSSSRAFASLLFSSRGQGQQGASFDGFAYRAHAQVEPTGSGRLAS